MNGDACPVNRRKPSKTGRLQECLRILDTLLAGGRMFAGHVVGQQTASIREDNTHAAAKEKFLTNERAQREPRMFA